MPCISWPARELFVRAELLADLLYRDSRVAAVAITGSLARHEDHVHDIDLVVFMKDTSTRWNVVYADPVPTADELYDTPVGLGYLFAASASRLAILLREARGAIPLNIIVMNYEVLFNCDRLNDLTASNTDKDFHKTILCEIPLILLLPDQASRQIRAHLRMGGEPTRTLVVDYGIPHHVKGVSLRHRCTRGCFPGKPWSQRQAEIQARRKAHCTRHAVSA